MTLLVSTRVWLGEYNYRPIYINGLRFNEITPKERNYCARALSVLYTDLNGKVRSFQLFHN